MNPINFVYWLQGFLEIGDPKSLNEVQIQEIRNHIALVLDKQTPNLNKDIYPLNGFVTDMNGNPFPNDFLVFTHEGSC